MENQPNWFNENKYADFLAESCILWEMNIPYQKQKFENRKKIAQFDRETSIRRGRLKSELTRDLYRAKAKGEQGLAESVFAAKIRQLSNDFATSLLAEAESKKTPLKAEKQRMRPQVDPKDKDRDRKREDRREAKQQGLSNIVIVKNNKLNKIEIITKEDFNSETHTLLKGKVKGLDKGNVTKRDLNYYSGLDNFMNTKTSVRLLGGRVERRKEDKKTTSEKTKEQEAPPEEMAPRMRVPKDGKEITDPDSTYPDWDHSSDQLIAASGEALNSISGGKPSKEYQQAVETSRTLGDAVQRFTKEILAAFPAAANMKFERLDPVVKTSKMWSSMGMEESQPNAILVGKGDGQKVGVSIKIGEQIRPTLKGESGLILNAIYSTAENAEPIVGSFDLFFQDLITDLKQLFTTNTVPTPIQSSKESIIGLLKQKQKQEQTQNTQKVILNKVSNLVESYVNENKDLKAAFLLEALTGNIKFDGKEGAAQLMFTAKKDGSDAKAIPLTSQYASALANSTDTDLTLKFIQAPNTSGGFLQSIFEKIPQLNESAIGAVAEIERIKSQVTNPMVLLQLFELQLADVVFRSPVVYSDFYTGETESHNTVTFNPGTNSQETIEIPVKTPYTPEGDPENVVEKGADALLEEYLLVNDVLIENVKAGNMDLLDALIFLEEQFQLDEKRNYRKEYDNYHGKPEQRANRSKRVLARRKMIKKGKVKKGDGKDVDHKNGNPQDNSDDNLRVLSKSKNRSMNEDHGAGFEGTPEVVEKLLKDTPLSNSPYIGKKSAPYPEVRFLKNKKK